MEEPITVNSGSAQPYQIWLHMGAERKRIRKTKGKYPYWQLCVDSILFVSLVQ